VKDNQRPKCSRDDSWFASIHERLLRNDPTAPSVLAEAALDLIVGRLLKANPRLGDSDLIQTAAIDALINYIKRPDQYNPTKRGLLGYLVMSAQGDLRNALAAIHKRQEREISLESVELRQIGRNIELELVDGDDANETVLGATAENLDSTQIERLIQELSALFDTQVDMDIAKLVLSGERDTVAFAKVLGINELDITEQRKEVKRQKDRIKKRIERWRAGQ
jgi:RNA polymerase sigma-70 factor (ECF subfamily)